MNQHQPHFVAIVFALLLGCGGMTDPGESPGSGDGGTDHGRGGAMAASGGAVGTAGTASVGTGGAGGARTTTGGSGGKVVGAAGAKSSGVGGAKATGAGGHIVGLGGSKDAGVGAGGSDRPDASMDGAKPAPDASSSVECAVNEDCVWGEISREIVVAADCMCLYGCPWIAMNRTTATRRKAQHSALCTPQRDGRGQPCGIDDCAMPPTIACVNHECRALPPRAGQACSGENECGTGLTCVAKAPGGYCVPGTANTPTNCGEGGASCPSGTACSPLPWVSSSRLCLQTCSTNADCRSNYRCDYLEHYPGDPGGEKSSEKVCWTACTPGIVPSCNPNSLMESIHGTCSADGTCQCSSSYPVDPTTGRCN